MQSASTSKAVHSRHCHWSNMHAWAAQLAASTPTMASSGQPATLLDKAASRAHLRPFICQSGCQAPDVLQVGDAAHHLTGPPSHAAWEHAGPRSAGRGDWTTAAGRAAAEACSC